MNNMIKPQKSASEQDYKDQLFDKIAAHEGDETALLNREAS